MSNEKKRDHPLALLFVLVLVVGALVGTDYVILEYFLPPTPKNIVLVVCGTIVYLLACYLFDTPKFDPHDLIWHPISVSDDINRRKFYQTLLMLPGIVLSISVVELFHEIRRRIG